jgi:hypothetical protein
VAAQATTDAQIPRLLDAGAHIAFSCRMSPVDLADELCRVMFDVSRSALSLDAPDCSAARQPATTEKVHSPTPRRKAVGAWASSWHSSSPP